MKHPFVIATTFVVLLIVADGAINDAAAQFLEVRDEPQSRFESAALSEGLVYVENRGQWPEEILYRARTGGLDLWVTRDGLTFDFYETERVETAASSKRETLTSERLAMRLEDTPELQRRGHVVRMRFEDARAEKVVGNEPVEGYYNYFLGNDRSHWASNVRRYRGVRLEELYPGVAMRLYSEDGFPRYDLVLAPGADLAQVRIRLEGTDAVHVTDAGALEMTTSLGTVEHRELIAYQKDIQEHPILVQSRFDITQDGGVRFVAGNYDRSRPLVIDPLIWSTLLGGNFGDRAFALGVSDDGSVTVSGRTASEDFPASGGAYRDSTSGEWDVFVTRLAKDGTGLAWSTFLGGSADDEVKDLVLDTEGNVTIAGWTESRSFPRLAASVRASMAATKTASLPGSRTTVPSLFGVLLSADLVTIFSAPWHSAAIIASP